MMSRPVSILRSNIQQSGIRMIKTQNRPTILGQYNFEKQNIVLRYKKFMIDTIKVNLINSKVRSCESALGDSGDPAA